MGRVLPAQKSTLSAHWPYFEWQWPHAHSLDGSRGRCSDCMGAKASLRRWPDRIARAAPGLDWTCRAGCVWSGVPADHDLAGSARGGGSYRTVDTRTLAIERDHLHRASMKHARQRIEPAYGYN